MNKRTPQKRKLYTLVKEPMWRSTIVLLFIVVGIYTVLRIIQKKSTEPYETYSNNALVMIEPRKHEKIEYVCKNFDSLMNPSWDMYIFHGASAGEFVKDATKNLSRRVILIPLETDNMTADDYNAFMKTDFMWDKIHAENVLIFQTDTVLCNNFKKSIEEFTKYNYIGCGNSRSIISFTGKSTSGMPYPFYGVGGLSFRKKSFWQKCVKEEQKEPSFPEDVLASHCVEKTKEKPESAEILQSFCSQNSFYKDIPSFGIHKPSVFGTMVDTSDSDSIEDMFAYCPAARNIL